uniref:ATP phosphoribosyltransferase n=1 Tax=Pyramimonas obovata TaxID=1411642 RepID=A0A7S0WVJ2_9CHLO|mmetsp:Transcript_6315/g.12826  ORF Transcript_6315/g.12826 Transcript_6315/m.12826 type:complete len:427 (+) Transcript_6315:83-1363(+)|eukprot:CAMPEP_0118934968 /NCGR_PEP_ID=MMETSP1169-20130426/14608_1 /TAXON_ID=36882 /ORGANISM="Pyramimonas obovata, Strain CCMP722" /LENGTH=426 /DNA_ID=CAMNT_0006877935 /DNA_START=54 /DNA_END=1334 /DNA_ORIENTATION=+
MSRAIARTETALRAAPSTRASGARRSAIANAPGCKRSLGSNASLFVSRGRFTDARQVKVQAEIAVENSPATVTEARTITRLAMPSKGRMAEDTLDLLKQCQLNVRKTNPRQYIAKISQLENMEVWFQRASDVVRRLRAGDVDIGILGNDMFTEFGEGDDDLIVLHEKLGFGHCHLALGVPTTGKWEEIHTLDDLKGMSEFNAQRPLRVVTGYHYIAKEYFKKVGLEHVQILAADGALEAAPQMDYADIILDLVSTGTTLRENNLKQLEGARIMESEGVLVARKQALLEQPGALGIVRELLERLDAHLTAAEQFTVVVNMRGESQEDVATKMIDAGLGGLQGPTVSRVFTRTDTRGVHDGEFYGVTICVAQRELYNCIKKIRTIGGSGILVSPLTYIFDEQSPRWTALLEELEIDDYETFCESQSIC